MRAKTSLGRQPDSMVGRPSDAEPVPPPRPRSSYALRPGRWRDVPRSSWNDWHWQLRHRVRGSAIGELIQLTDRERRAIDDADFPICVTPHYAALLEEAEGPVRLQCVPSLGEGWVFPFELTDPLGEDAHMPVPGVTHRYPDRALLCVSLNCSVYCRHCTRRRKVGSERDRPTRASLEVALDYIAATRGVRDVLVSGGDALSLSTRRLAWVLGRLRDIEHIDVIRLGTRCPVTLPQRIDGALCETLSTYAPLYLNTHFNHPSEATEEAEKALGDLRQAGCILGNQMVLLSRVNDDPRCVESLNRWLLRQGCRPYYMLMPDMAEGITHFRSRLTAGVAVLEHLRGRIGGLGIPSGVVDLPGGGGKVPFLPNYVVEESEERVVFRNWRGERYEYADVDGYECVQSRWNGTRNEPS